MAGTVQSVRVSIRSSADRSEVSLPWELATSEVLASAGPWRTFRWHKGQRHYSGTYWSATEHGHVIYESRLELARLLSERIRKAAAGRSLKAPRAGPL